MLKGLVILSAALLILVAGAAVAQDLPGPGMVETDVTFSPTLEEAGAECLPFDTDKCTIEGMGWVGGSDYSYCNRDRSVKFSNEVSVAQWMLLRADYLDRYLRVRKPGTYTFCMPMVVMLASNGDVAVSFETLTKNAAGKPSWDAEYYGQECVLPGRVKATPLVNQQPVDKKFLLRLIDSPIVAGGVFNKWVDVPVNFTFKNSLNLHGVATCGIVPIVGFTMEFQDIVVPCNTVGNYRLDGKVNFDLMNQMCYIDPMTGCFR